MWTVTITSQTKKEYLQITRVKQPNLRHWIHFFQMIKVVQGSYTHTLCSLCSKDKDTTLLDLQQNSHSGAQILALCTHADESFAFQNKNCPHPSSHSDPTHTVNSRFVSLHTVCTCLYICCERIRMKWTEDLWFPWCHSLPGVTGGGLEVQRLVIQWAPPTTNTEWCYQRSMRNSQWRSSKATMFVEESKM